MKTAILIVAISGLALAGCAGLKEDPRQPSAVGQHSNIDQPTPLDRFNPALAFVAPTPASPPCNSCAPPVMAH